MKKLSNKISKIFVISFLFIAALFTTTSCEVGLGEAVDLQAPELEITTPEPTSSVAKEFTIAGTVKDNIGVTKLEITITETGQKFKWEAGEWQYLNNGEWQIYEKATHSGNELSFDWSINLSVAGAKSGDTFTLSTTATDAAKNEGTKSKDERSITVDVNEPVVSIISPALITESITTSQLAKDTYDSYKLNDGESIQNLINKEFTISGTQKEDTHLGSLFIMLDTQTTETIPSFYDQPDITALNHVFIKQLDGSRSWECKVTESDLPEQYRTGKQLFRLVTESHDLAGNVERVVQGWFSYWNEADVPWLVAKFGDDEYKEDSQTLVYPNCSLQGQAYDDDGLSKLEILVETLNPDSHKWEKDNAKSVIYDLSDSYPTFYSWGLLAISETKHFRVFVKCVDKYGVEDNSKIVRYLGVSDVNPPEFVDITPANGSAEIIGNANGKFTVRGTIQDDGILNKATALKIVRIKSGRETDILDYFDSEDSGWKIEKNGNKLFTLPLTGTDIPVGGYYTYSFEKEFDIFNDFGISASETIKAHSFIFRVSDEKSARVESYSLQGDTEAPELKITKIKVFANGTGNGKEYSFEDAAQPVLDPFNTNSEGKIVDTVQYSGTWSDNSTNKWTSISGKTKTDLINNIILKCKETIINVTMNNDGTWESAKIAPEESTTSSITASLTDFGNNKTEAKASYSVNPSVPKIVRITAKNPDGAYKIGDLITLVVEFNKRMTFSGNGGTIKLNNGGTATYDTASETNGSSKHEYIYEVKSTDSNIDVLNVTSIEGAKANWKDSHEAILSSLTPETNLADVRKIKIDKGNPFIQSLSTVTAGGYYNKNKEIFFSLVFNKPVTYSPSFTNVKLILELNGEEKELEPRQTSAESLLYKYVVDENDCTDTDPKQLTFKEIKLNGCEIKDYAGNELDSSVPSQSAINWNAIYIDNKSPTEPVVVIDDNSIVYDDSGVKIAITGFETTAGTKKYYSVDNGTSWRDDYNDTDQINLTANGTYTIIAYQVDAAGNPSYEINNEGEPVYSAAKIVTLDKGNILTSITSTIPDGIYTTGKELDITLNFRKPVKVKGSKLKLNINKEALPVSEPESTAATTITYKYTVKNGDDVEKLEVAEFIIPNPEALESGEQKLTDVAENDISAYVNLPAAGSGNRLQENREIKIVTGAPAVSSVGFNPNDGKLSITFTSTIKKSNGNIVLKVKDGQYKAPGILTPSEWTGYNTTIKAYYEKGTNGSNGLGVADLTEKYVLKYTYDMDETGLLSALKTAGADTVTIPIDSTSVSIGGATDNILEIDVSDAYKLPIKGAEYTIAIPASLVINELGTANAEDNTQTVKTPGVEKPVIRINKARESISGTTITQPTTATVKIDCQTPDAKIYYIDDSKTSDTRTLSRTHLPASGPLTVMPKDTGTDRTAAPADSSITTLYSSAITVGSESDTEKGYKVLIAAKAYDKDKTESGAVASETSYESAFRSVVIFTDRNAFDDSIKNSGYDYRWIRGGDWTMGGVSTPGFPFSWDTSDYDKARAMTNSSDSTWYWITWEINTTAYVGFLAGDMPDDASTMGPSIWCWGSCAWVGLKQYYPVYPGESLTLPTFISGTDDEGNETTDDFSNIGGTGRGGYAYQGKHCESR